VKGYFGFLRDRRADLARIARRTDGEYSPEDLESEAWLVANEIGEKRARPIDLDDVIDQEGVLARLYTRFVKFADKTLRWGVRLDRGWEGEGDDLPPLLDKLAATDSSDPQADEQADQDAVLVANAQASYSQVSFYAALMVRVDWSVREVASLVHVTASGLRGRLKRLAAIAGLQPSLFDGREPVPAQFVPQPGRWRFRAPPHEPDPRQLSFWQWPTLASDTPD
jgi:hypothetical protein